jgi:heptaprenyl diphosphate synthase
MDYPIKKERKMSRTQKIVFMSLLVAQAIVLSYIETMIPLNFNIPGAKLGLANIITLTALYLFSFKECLVIIILRTTLTAFLSGTFSVFLYSISGAVLSFLAMYLLIRIGAKQISAIGISMVGAIFHNLGQLLMAALIIQNIKITLYLPFLMVSAIATGFVVGISVKYLLQFIKRLNFF